MHQYQRERIAQNQRLAHRRLCRSCRSWTLVGPDADDVALTAIVDIKPVDRATEAVALAAGAYSCDYKHGKLFYREPWHTGVWRYERHGLTESPGNENEQAIHIEHRCSTK